jgi:hypothetical protein
LGGLFFALSQPSRKERAVRQVLASFIQFLSFDVVTLGARLRALKDADDKLMMVATTLLADGARIFIAAWIAVVFLRPAGGA